MWGQLADPWRACLEEAWAALCAGSVPVGAAVAAGDHIVSRGRNHLLDRTGLASEVQGNPLAHAELNALIALDYGAVDRHACVLFTTTEPCPLCMGALYMSGVRELRYACRDPFAGSVNLLGTTAYLSRKPVSVIPPASPALENVVAALTTGFALREGFREGLPAWLGAWQRVLPDGVQLGQRAFESRWLQQMRERGAPISEVVDGLTVLAGSG